MLVIPRSEHPLSRRDIDPDALEVLYRLHRAGHLAYLVGGSVRDLLLGRKPKDFDIGTSAHPYQVKRLFRNCWIIGRRFRLAHVRFGTKVVEVATFRRRAEFPPASEPAPSDQDPSSPGTGRPAPEDLLIHRDNTFGTAEEDAFRRDFTVNALFYDIATFTIIDYVGGLADLRSRLVRCIGDPDERFREDPVRMLRAVALAARLNFAIDPPIEDAISRHRSEIVRSSPARVLDELYKILRAGAAEAAFRGLARFQLLEPIAPDLLVPDPAPLWASLARLDAFRSQSAGGAEALTNPVLLGSLLVPLGLIAPARPGGTSPGRSPLARPALGAMPVARRDLERLRVALGLQPRLLSTRDPERLRPWLVSRPGFGDAVTWLEVHSEQAQLASQWRAQMHKLASGDPGEAAVPRRRRRRRRPRRPPQGG